jgi:hypothetical protein
MKNIIIIIIKNKLKYKLKYIHTIRTFGQHSHGLLDNLIHHSIDVKTNSISHQF